MRDMYQCQPNSPRLTDLKNTNISALISPTIIRRQRSLGTTPIDLEKSTSVPNFPPISRTKSDVQNVCLRKMDDGMPTGESIRQVYVPQKPRPPRPGTPTFNSPFFRRRATQTHNPLEKRVLSEPSLETSLLVGIDQRKSQIFFSENISRSSRLGSRQGSRSSQLVRPNLRARFNSSTQESISNISTEELNMSTELSPHQGKLTFPFSSDGSLHNATGNTRQQYNFTNRIDQDEHSVPFPPDTSPTHDRIIESDELIMDKITDLPTKDLVDKCQKWLEGVALAKERTPMA